MKRTPFQRNTPLEPGKPLERKTGLRRTGRIAHKPSRRTERAYDELGIDLGDFWLVDPLWPMARAVALRRDRHTCTRCGQPGGDVHHRVAKQAGGRIGDPERHAPERCVTLCRSCHGWVHGHPAAAGEAGYVVATGDDPLRVAVQTWTGTVLLDHHGRMSTLIPRFR